MNIYNGMGIVPGTVRGAAHMLTRPSAADATPAADAELEWSRFLAAREEAREQLDALLEKTRRELGQEAADIIDVQRMMLDDGDFNDAVEKAVRHEHSSAAYAVEDSGRRFAGFFSSLDDSYMRARATDVKDMANRVANILLGGGGLLFDGPVIVVADDLTPSETLQMDKSKVLAFVIRQGSANSHTAILARSMNVPCLIQTNIPLPPAIQGRTLAVDGETGLCWLEPDEATRAQLAAKQKTQLEERQRLHALHGLPSTTRSRRKIKIFANIGGVEDLSKVLENDSEGIGLFRSEFLYLGRDSYPGEEELFNAYRKVVQGMDGKQVIIRTLDIGADKRVGYFQLGSEENPALGLRGVRLCLTAAAISLQLRAIYRASAFGCVAVMFPMISSLWEVRSCREIAAAVRQELSSEGIAIGEAELGIMIETPSSVMIAEMLAKEVDFFSVGTNDLTQYVLAVDRQNSKLDRFYDPHHPAVLEMLRITAKAATGNGIWAGICGELAADLELTKTFIDMGYTELSASPAHTLAIRGRVREIG